MSNKQQTSNSNSNSKSSTSTSSSPILSFLLALIKVSFYLASKLPYWVWIGLIFYGYYQYKQFNDPQNKRIRSRNRLPKPSLPSSPSLTSAPDRNTPKQSFTTSPLKQQRTASSAYRPSQLSPQISRRSSSVFAPRTLPRSSSFSSNLGLESPGRPAMMLRGSYSSQRISSLAGNGGNSGRSGSPVNSRFQNDDGILYQQSLPSPKPLISPYDLPPLFPSFRQQQSSSSSFITNNNYIAPSQPSPFDFNSNYESNLGRKRSLSKRIREYSVDLSGDEFNREDDQERVGKRFKDHQDHEDEEESGREMDVDIARIAREELSQSKRGTKRAVSDDDEQDEEIDDRRKSRRVLSESPYRSQDEEDDDVSQEEDENASIIISPNRKRRSHPEPNLDKFNSNSEFKKSKSGLRGKPGGKRIIENVSSDDEEEELVGGRSETRNADSEGEEEEINDEINQVKDSRGKSIKKNKSTRALLEDEDEDLMDGAFASSPPPSPPHSSAPSSSNPKRTLSTKIIKKSQSNLGRRTPVKVSSSISSSNLSSGKVERKKGEEWVNLEGDRYKLDKDGVQRRCCEVREIRKKFKMPKDSKHPDRNITHEVVVEKWLTDAEFEAALKAKKLAWQTQDSTSTSIVADVGSGATTDTEVGDVSLDADRSVDVQPRESGIYYTPGTGTPLRTHSGLSSTFSSGGNNKSNRSTPLSSIPLSLSSNSLSANSPGISPVYKNNYLNGRLRLPSGTPLSSAGGSKNRAWSEIKSKLVVEDEEKKELEREKRRAASVRLGGEVPEIISNGKGKEKKAVVDVVEEKLPVSAPEKSLFGIPPVLTGSSAVVSTLTVPKALPAFNLKPIPVPIPTSTIATPLPSLFSAPAKSNTPASLPPLSIPSTTTPSAKVPDFFSKPLAASPKAIPNFFANVASSNSVDTSLPTPPVVAAVPTQAASFSFGSAPVPKVLELPTSTAKSNSFSFTPASAATALTPVPSAISAPVPAAAGFGAAATSVPVAQSPFSFGSTSTALPTPPIPLPTSTSLFGTAPSTTTSGFSFGASVIPAASPFASATPSITAAPFSFSNSAPSTGSFGTAPATSAAPSPFSFGTSVASTPAFGSGGTGFGGTSTFGASAAFGTNSTPVAANAGFNFGIPTAVPGASSGIFGGGAAPAVNMFGANPTDPGAGESGDERRMIRRRPVRKG